MVYAGILFLFVLRLVILYVPGPGVWLRKINYINKIDLLLKTRGQFRILKLKVSVKETKVIPVLSYFFEFKFDQ